MLILIIAGIIGFSIGRAISLIVSLLFQQHVSLNLKEARTLIVLGSGGHTTEMLEIVKTLKTDKYTPRHYVVAENDSNSVDKLMAIEKDNEDYKIYMINRSRKVHQSYFTSIFTTLRAIVDCFPLLLHTRPDLILSNGPSTCVPVCFVAFILKVFYINSGCKPRTLKVSAVSRRFPFLGGFCCTSATFSLFNGQRLVKSQEKFHISVD